MRRERFLEELETYNKQVEELAELGELAELPRYLRRAQALEERLQQALDRTAAINDEEEAFQWDTTNYPRRKEVRRDGTGDGMDGTERNGIIRDGTATAVAMVTGQRIEKIPAMFSVEYFPLLNLRFFA